MPLAIAVGATDAPNRPLRKIGRGTYGFKVNGTLDAEPRIVKLNGQLPFAAVMFKGRIESSIRDEIVKLLS